jgi:hypothetical protein
MATTETTTVIAAGDLIMLNREAARKYNRVLSDAVIHRLDDDGVNLVVFSLASDDYMRVLLMVKLDDRDEPVQAWLDMSYDRFNALARVQKQDGEWVTA